MIGYEELVEFGLETAARLGAIPVDIQFVDGKQSFVDIKKGNPVRGDAKNFIFRT